MIHYTLSNNRLLPIEYQEVAYLESTDSLYIDTGYYLDWTTDFLIELDFDYSAITDTSQYKCIFGYRTSSNTLAVFCRGDGSMGIDYVLSSGSLTVQTNHTDRHHIILNRLTTTVDGVTYNNTYTYYLTSTTAVNQFWIFQGAGNPGIRGGTKVKYYKVSIYNSGKLQRHFVPCYRISDSKPGMYDIVEKKFYTNQGTGEFLVGDAISEILEIDNSGGGGQTLLSDSAEYSGVIPSSSYTEIKLYTNVKYVYPDESYTVIFDAKSSTAGAYITTYFYNNSSGIVQVTNALDYDGRMTTNLTTEYKLYIIHYQFSSTGNPAYKRLLFRAQAQGSYTGATLYVKNIKLYRGTIPGIGANAQLNNVGYSYGIRGNYDTNIYTESDGSKWIRIFHHNNPANALFASDDTFTTGVYKDADRWFDVAKCNEVNKWELMVKQMPTSDGTLSTYRWILYANPMTATWLDVVQSKVKKYHNSYNGLFKKNGNAYLAADNGTNGNNWWGAVGAWSTHSSGIPAFGGGIVTTGYYDLYLRVDNVCPIYSGCYELAKNGYITFPNIGVKAISYWRKLYAANLLFVGFTGDHAGNIYTDATTSNQNTYKSSTLNSMTYYMDGVLVSKFSLDTNWHHYVINNISPASGTTVNNWGLNWYSANEWNLRCYVQDLRIYDYALADDEIKLLYNMKNI